MRVGIQTYGSTGDVRPLLGLAAALRAAGHTVIATITSIDGADYTDLCRALDVECVSVANPGHGLSPLSALSGHLGALQNPFRQLRMLLDTTFFARIDEIYAAARELCARSDYVVGHFLVYPLAVAARLSGTPHASVIITPGMLPSAHHPPPGSLDIPNLGTSINRLLWSGVEWTIDREFKSRVNGLWRREGLLPPKHVLSGAWQSDTLNLIAVSPQFVRLEPDWADRFRVCGELRIPEWAEAAVIPDSLTEFLAAGPRPVYMTSGSVQLRPAAKETTIMVEAARCAHCRAIIQTRLANLANWTDGGIYFVHRIPHQAVFPHCAAVVHHAGAQTCMTAVRSGCPSILVPYIQEQVIWAKTLHRLGLGAKPLSWRQVTPRRLAAAVSEVMGSAALAANTERTGRILRSENGGARGVRIIEESLSRR